MKNCSVFCRLTDTTEESESKFDYYWMQYGNMVRIEVNSMCSNKNDLRIDDVNKIYLCLLS